MAPWLAIGALLISAAIYLIISWRLHRQTEHVDDLIPISKVSGLATVDSSAEFNAATVAPTISLATVILAFAELAPSMGSWLLWTVFTTALGIFVVRLFAAKMWARSVTWDTDRPTLHDFLGRSFKSETLKYVASICTSIGFLGAFAVELTVGTRFLSTFVPFLPQWLSVTILASLGLTYTVLGGFRAVIITDRIQMWAIWATIASLLGLIAWKLGGLDGYRALLKTMPRSVYDLSWRDGLAAFLVGIFVINVPTFLSDMSVWQRVLATRERQVVTRGLSGSMLVATLSWGALAVICCVLVGIAHPTAQENVLYSFMSGLPVDNSFLVAAAFTIAVAGFYAASLSATSTQLVATAHTIHTDILRIDHDRDTLAHPSRSIRRVRLILIFGAVVSVAIVVALELVGFSISDLVFAIYGAQLGMVPAVVVALTVGSAKMERMGFWASAAVALGFAGGWASALLGKYWNNGDMVFLAPAVSLTLSGVVLGFSLLMLSGRSKAAT